MITLIQLNYNLSYFEPAWSQPACFDAADVGGSDLGSGQFIIWFEML